VGTGVPGWVAEHRRALRVADLSSDSFTPIGEGAARASLCVPMSYRGELLGVLNVESEFANVYDENDEEMLQTLGSTLAAIIANTRLIERQRLLFEVTAKIRRSVDVGSILKTTVNELSTALGARRARIEVGLEKVVPVQPGETIADGENGNQGIR
jgi:signal transduction protein with GAF and PtsI domain